MDFLMRVVICGLTVHAVNTDEFALMVNSLKTFQVHACDGNELRLECPENTVISISYANYGQPPARQNDGPCGQVQKMPQSVNLDKDCSSQNAVKVIMKSCHKQSSCRFITTPKIFQDDPCPGVKKYAEVAFKCRPDVFHHRLTCRGNILNLNCDPLLSILVFSASFGSSPLDVMECQNSQLDRNEYCGSPYVSETVAGDCTGKKQCTLMANYESFGKTNCSPTTAEQLKVVYACVSPSILRIVDDPLKIAIEDVEDSTFPRWTPDDAYPQILPDSSFNSQSTIDLKNDSIRKSNVTDDYNKQVVGFVRGLLSAEKYVRGNQQKLILYVSLSLVVGFVFFILIVFLHHCLRSSDLKVREKLDVPPAPEDFFSESDLENYEGEDSQPAEDTVRKISDAIPRAPISNGPESNHFFS